MVAGFTYKDAFILLMYEDEVYKRSVGDWKICLD